MYIMLLDIDLTYEMCFELQLPLHRLHHRGAYILSISMETETLTQYGLSAVFLATSTSSREKNQFKTGICAIVRTNAVVCIPGFSL